jgi:hypothetical protein
MCTHMGEVKAFVLDFNRYPGTVASIAVKNKHLITVNRYGTVYLYEFRHTVPTKILRGGGMPEHFREHSNMGVVSKSLND